MILKIFAVFDVKANAFITPFFLPNRAMAIRILKETVNDKTHQIGKHPEDFALYELGEFDDQSGMFNSEKPEYVINAIGLKDQDK